MRNHARTLLALAALVGGLCLAEPSLFAAGCAGLLALLGACTAAAGRKAVSP